MALDRSTSGIAQWRLAIWLVCAELDEEGSVNGWVTIEKWGIGMGLIVMAYRLYALRAVTLSFFI